ncbi:MAG: DNA gyrase subunit A, partial [Bacteroidia bacterium]|nr:DNA gyrase subunit A [Bacteroidia bacterium]MDW8334301.1 DNA gyrase subunit A [Bacteroidia bacterium]
VGMATNMAPHNLREVVEGIIAYIDNRDISVDELIKYVKAPDFPTGGVIYGMEGVYEAFRTGRGKVVVRALARIETHARSGRERIIVTELPYLVNKAALHEKIHELAVEKKIDGIAEIRDESDRDGLRLVIELKKDAQANVVLNALYKMTSMQTAFSVNNVALVGGRPALLNLKDLIRHFVDHRHEVVIRRAQYELDQALQRAHILEGLIVALDHLDEVIALIRSSATVEAARNGLMERFGLSEIQAKAILDMRLQRLTNLERDKIRAEYQEVLQKIEYLRRVLAEEPLRMQIIKEELREIGKKYGDERRTQIVHSAEDFRIEDIIAEEDVVVTISRMGYIKRTPLKDYRRQGRGGVGAKGAATKEEDFVEHLFIANTHHYMLFFTEKGRCYWLKAFEIPEGTRSQKGRAIQNLIQIASDDKIRAVLNVPKLNDAEYCAKHSVLMCTQNGLVKKTLLSEYSNPRSTGVNAITITEGDSLLSAALVDDSCQVMLATRSGYAVRFQASEIRDMGRTAAGVRGVRLDESKNDVVVGMIVVRNPNAQVLVLSENGFGKRSLIEDYRLTARGSKGVKTMNITEKTGPLAGIAEVGDQDDLMIMTREGVAIRFSMKDVPQTSRNTQGVRLIRLRENDGIAGLTKLAESDDDASGGDEKPSLPLENTNGQTEMF